MTEDTSIKQEVREFYDRIGWKLAGDSIYQNARFEDLRPVAREYIQNCHRRVNRHIKSSGQFFLDAGSGPIQYPEYLEYSEDYHTRVCTDISHVALKEARDRIGDLQDGGRGIFVVGDIANLPFKLNTFNGIVSLHTIHHLPLDQHLRAYQELYRVLSHGSSMVVVNSWYKPKLEKALNPLVIFTRRLRRFINRRKGSQFNQENNKDLLTQTAREKRTGTFINRTDAEWVKQEIATRLVTRIWVWRSVSVKFMRSVIHPGFGGRILLKFIYWLEEKFPHYLGEIGQYPLIVISKPEYVSKKEVLRSKPEE